MSVTRKKFISVLDGLRKGKSLYAACCQNGLSTRDFYQLMNAQSELKDDFYLALSDYADQCTDDIRALAYSLKNGDIDTSTAKLLIETQKWLAQKACPDPVASFADDEAEKLSEIVVKFVS